MKKTEELQMTVVIDENVHVTTESIVFALFGMSMEALAREIRDNTESKYDGIVTNLIAV